MKLVTRFFLVIVLYSSVDVFAAPADDAFDRGLAAARSGQWAVARDQFITAQRAGMDRAALHYNLGVAYYRLGNYPQAAQAFRRAATAPSMASLARYNLGLVALREGDFSVAGREFSLAARTSDDTRRRKLAADQLALLSTRRADEQLRLTIAANAGYDDSIVDPLSQTGIAEGSAFTELLAGADSPISGNRQNGWLVDGRAFTVRYPDQDTYDSNLLRLGLSRVVRRDQWQTRLAAQWEHSTLGDEDYLQSMHVIARGDTDDLSLFYRLSLISALNSIYDPLAGVRHQARAEKQWFSGDYVLRLGYGFEYNDREDLRDAATFASYSPVRNELTAGLTLAAGQRTDIYIDLRYRDSRYLDPNRLSDGSRVTRDDRRAEAGITLSHGISSRLSLDAAYLHTENDSNLSSYDYTQNIYTVGVSAFF